MIWWPTVQNKIRRGETLKTLFRQHPKETCAGYLPTGPEVYPLPFSILLCITRAWSLKPHLQAPLTKSSYVGLANGKYWQDTGEHKDAWYQGNISSYSSTVKVSSSCYVSSVIPTSATQPWLLGSDTLPCAPLVEGLKWLLVVAKFYITSPFPVCPFGNSDKLVFNCLC